MDQRQASSTGTSTEQKNKRPAPLKIETPKKNSVAPQDSTPTGVSPIIIDGIRDPPRLAKKLQPLTKSKDKDVTAAGKSDNRPPSPSTLNQETSGVGKDPSSSSKDPSSSSRDPSPSSRKEDRPPSPSARVASQQSAPPTPTRRSPTAFSFANAAQSFVGLIHATAKKEEAPSPQTKIAQNQLQISTEKNTFRAFTVVPSQPLQQPARSDLNHQQKPLLLSAFVSLPPS
eukprot:TRINITY_DN10845_c0_g1_i1.p1 TRINITY_DN10845_c0_g1~~TRINITY_DN10845_c0_g1_i1.p1  ORF type:complete len:229 (+),score=60.14 TRINITY_DN10845_c0_g1_i1:125-811(+)